MVAIDNRQAEELKRHQEAYVLLFESLLKKRIDDAETLEGKLSELKSLIHGIADTDGFIERLPDFGRILQIREDQLGAYIGQNFLKALSVIEERHRQAESLTADVFAQDGPLIDTILSKIGPIVAPPDRFQPLDGGLVKLIRNGQEVLPQSVSATSESDSTPADASSEAGQGATEAEKDDLPVAGLRREKSIIAEILERFGNILDVHEALVPKAFSADEEAFVVEEVAPAAKESTEPVETSILEEILQRFGDELKVSGRLVPAEYSGDESFFDAAEAEDQPAGPAFEPIGVSLTSFAAIRARMAEFQKNQDRAGYQAYLSTASNDIKAVVALLNLSARQRKQAINLDEELFRISQTLPYSQEQLQELFRRMDRYAKATTLVNEFTARVKQASAPVQMELRKVWQQVLDLLDEDLDEVLMKQRAKIILLAVNPTVKPTIESGIMSLISRIASL